MTIFTGAHLVEFLAAVTATLLARAARGWFKQRHAPTVSPVSPEARAQLVKDDNPDH